MSQFKQFYLIDPNYPAFGDYATIGAFLTAAAAGGVSPTNKWIAYLGPYTFTENVVVPAGVRIIGQGPTLTRIDGYVDLKAGAVLKDVYCWATTTPTAADYAIRLVNDVDGRSTYIFNCYAVAASSAFAGTTAVIKLTGSANTSQLYIHGGWFYANNTRSGANTTSIRNCHYWCTNDFNYAVESFNVHHKSSCGGTGTSIPTLIFNECTTPASGFGYVHISFSDYLDAHGGNGTCPAPVFVQSANTVHPGAMLDCAFISINNYYTALPAVNIAYTGSKPVLYSHASNRARIYTRLTRLFSGADLDFNPSLYGAAAPTGALVAPDGTMYDDI